MTRATYDDEEARAIEAREAIEGTWMVPDGPFVRRGERSRSGDGRQRGDAPRNRPVSPGLLAKLLTSEEYQEWCDALDFRRQKETR